MSFWNQQDILNYIVKNKIPYAKSVYGDIVSDKNNKLKTTKCERTGCAFCLFGIHREKYPNRLQLLKVQYPKMYQYCMENLGYKKVLDFLEIDAECPAQQNFNFTD
jgi:predicted nuclease of restriction endonuclease-like (RecB) superfamily